MKSYLSSINYGSFAGVGSFLAFLLFFYLNISPLGGISWLYVWIPVLCIYLGIKYYRDNEQEGFIIYSKALKVGILISFIYASLFAMLVYLFGILVNAVFVDWQINSIIEELEKSEKGVIAFFGENRYEMMYDKIESMTLGDIVIDDFWDKMFGGFFASLFIANSLKKIPENELL